MARYSRNDQAGVELPKARLDRESLKQAVELFRYLRPYRARFSVAMVALFASSLLSLSFPYLAGSIIDAAVLRNQTGGSMAGVDRTALLLMGILALQAGLSFFHSLSFATVGQRSLVDLRRDTYARLISLPMTFFAQRRVGELASRLSADLKYGLVHPRQIMPGLRGRGRGADVFRSELCWREFYADVLWHRPETARRALVTEMEEIRVDEGPAADDRFDAWRLGRTGYPFIDAGMRQLLREGWMHNRTRMAAASFLVKDLHLDGRRGARWFMDQLVDGDLASNQHGWQWTAGTGTDASPYYRVFNPVLQGKKFDPDGEYVRRYVPELRDMSTRFIHEPWSAPLTAGALFDVDMAEGPASYPAPIVDHATERVEALARLAEIRSADGPSMG